MRQPLLDFETETFTRGVFEGKTLDDVAEEAADYLVWIVEESEAAEDVKEYIESWLFQHPDHTDRVQL